MRYLREIVGKTVKTHSELGACPHVFLVLFLSIPYDKILDDISQFRIR